MSEFSRVSAAKSQKWSGLRQRRSEHFPPPPLLLSAASSGPLSQGHPSTLLERERRIAEGGWWSPVRRSGRWDRSWGGGRGGGGFPGMLWDHHDVVPCNGAHTTSSTGTHPSSSVQPSHASHG